MDSPAVAVVAPPMQDERVGTTVTGGAGARAGVKKAQAAIRICLGRWLARVAWPVNMNGRVRELLNSK